MKCAGHWLHLQCHTRPYHWESMITVCTKVFNSDSEFVVLHRLPTTVRDVWTHDSQPFQDGNDRSHLAIFGSSAKATFGCIEDFSLPIAVQHSFLKEGRPDDLPRQVLHRFLMFRLDAVSAEDMEAGIPPYWELWAACKKPYAWTWIPVFSASEKGQLSAEDVCLSLHSIGQLCRKPCCTW